MLKYILDMNIVFPGAMMQAAYFKGSAGCPKLFS